ncbi:hypothetical protein EYF80_010514 [Liparis tanakae]|uniref:Uncharacterized protein n=1 Tax=Liparis tanakae TaxID=230148 RepID=A0A4Z2IMN1_9TELE|nr:hypothetical protein EYF80_010514 [Liparis tanakae]
MATLISSGIGARTVTSAGFMTPSISPHNLWKDLRVIRKFAFQSSSSNKKQNRCLTVSSLWNSHKKTGRSTDHHGGTFKERCCFDESERRHRRLLSTHYLEDNGSVEGNAERDWVPEERLPLRHCANSAAKGEPSARDESESPSATPPSTTTSSTTPGCVHPSLSLQSARGGIAMPFTSRDRHT